VGFQPVAVGAGDCAELGQTAAPGSRGRRWDPDWPAGHFITWDQADFERYYPELFKAEVAAALSQPHDAKREAKKQLLDDVKAWCAADQETAKTAFEQSAAEVIRKLRRIEQVLFSKPGA
jgi:hypothetical protein